ncbi:MAG: hypothetical protein JWO60_722, partial [Frankiales bacterium]|nr:hypothetical protein [Frankiales bacterium]
PVPGPAAPAPRPGPPTTFPTPAAVARPSAARPSTDAAAAPVPPAVAAALEALTGVTDRPLDEHVEVFDEVHRRLQDALAALDER